jgi:hypothetical protein
MVSFELKIEPLHTLPTTPTLTHLFNSACNPLCAALLGLTSSGLCSTPSFFYSYTLHKCGSEWCVECVTLSCHVRRDTADLCAHIHTNGVTMIMVEPS